MIISVAEAPETIRVGSDWMTTERSDVCHVSEPSTTMNVTLLVDCPANARSRSSRVVRHGRREILARPDFLDQFSSSLLMTSATLSGGRPNRLVNWAVGASERLVSISSAAWFLRANAGLTG